MQKVRWVKLRDLHTEAFIEPERFVREVQQPQEDTCSYQQQERPWPLENGV
jgi:hypothetical protein